MQASNKNGIGQSNKKNRLRKTVARLREPALNSLSTILRSLWSLRGAVSIVVIIVLFNIVQILVVTWGKLVVLPFEVRTEQTLSPDFGAAFAAGLAARLNDYRELFPSSDAQLAPIIEKYDSSFDIVESFLAALPLVSIPRLAPFNKGSMTLESVKIGPVSLPIGQIIFENLAFFHTDTLRGALESFGDQITARLSLETGETMVISVPKGDGYRKLIDRISVELLERKYISPIPMNPAALLEFTKGLESYRNYARTGEESFLLAARRNYEAALKADRNADLVQLHLATTEYISWNEDDLRQAVTHFSALLGSEKYGYEAKIAHVAAELRLMERTKGCTRKYQFMEPALREMESWTDSTFPHGKHFDFEVAVVKAELYRVADTNILANSECHEVLAKFFAGETFNELAGKAEQNFIVAEDKLTISPHLNASQKQRYGDEIQLQKKYLLNDRTDFAILSKTGKDNDFALAAVQAGDELERTKKTLPSDVQKRMFAPFLSGSNAESYLRLAMAVRDHPADQNKFIAHAIDLLEKAILEGNEETAKWAILRLADIELSRNHTHEGLERINDFFNLAGSGTTPFFKLVDEHAFAAGILIEKPQMRCEAIEVFRKAEMPESAFGRLLTEDAYRRAGDLAAAAARRSGIEDASLNATQWLGPTIAAKMTLARAKIDAVNGNVANATEVLKNLKTKAPGYQNVPMLLADAYELALLVHDTESLAQLDRALNMPFIRELLPTNQSTSSICKATG
jgi:hypothetical protein